MLDAPNTSSRTSDNEKTHFTYDVFLSYSSADRQTVQEIAERLQSNGIKVWFDAWEISQGNSIPSNIELALENSRTLVLCLSRNAIASDWVTLENQTFRFRDPVNKQRRFIMLRLDNTTPPGSLCQFLHADWHGESREQTFVRLSEACRPSDRSQNLEEFSIQEGCITNVVSLGHTDSVESVAISPDGQTVVSGSVDNTIRLWDIQSGHCIRVLEGHANRVNSVAWSPNGLNVLSGSSDSTLRLWEAKSGRCLRVFAGHTGSVASVAWSDDAQKVLSGSSDSTLRVWDVNLGSCLCVLEGHTKAVFDICWKSDANVAISGSEDNTVRVWDVQLGRCVRVLHGHHGSVWCVSLSGNGRYAISGSYDNTVRVWQIEDGQCVSTLNGHTEGVWSVSMDPDGQYALSGSSDNTVRFWDLKQGRCVDAFEGHTDRVNCVAWYANGSRALSGSSDTTIRVWDVSSGLCEKVFEGHSDSVVSVSWNADKKFAISGSSDGTVCVWDMQNGQCLHKMSGHLDRVLSVSCSSDGHYGLSSSSDNAVRVWDLLSGRCLHTYEGHTKSVFDVAGTKEGQIALSSSEDNTIRVWDIHRHRCLRVLEGHHGSVLSVSISPDGYHAVSGSYDNTARVWEVQSGRCSSVLYGHTEGIWSLSWCPQGKHIASGASDNTVRVWDVQNARCLRILEGHTGRVTSVSWSADGRYLVSGSTDMTVRVWNVESGDCPHLLKGHHGGVTSVSFSSDSTLVYSSAMNGVIRVWNLASLKPRECANPSQEGEYWREDQIQYTNAKVLLVGDSSSGKTGLSFRLATNRWESSASTTCAWATQLKIGIAGLDNVEKEIWLWDFGGQADQRLIHQLYMHETAVAILVFDGQKDNFFETIEQWDRDLCGASKASSRPFVKLLVAGRIDAGGLSIGREQLHDYAKERGFQQVLETSAKEDIGCRELKQAVVDAIDWTKIQCRSTSRVFKLLKDEIIRLKDSGRVLMRFNELRDALSLHLKESVFTDEELHSVLTLLKGPGVVWELEFGSWILLQPSYINTYAQAVIRTLQKDPDERGCITEERVLAGDLVFNSEPTRLSIDEERIVLLAMLQTVVKNGLCIRICDASDPPKHPTLLVFPSYYRRARPELGRHPCVFVSYLFSGFLDDIYATLVVRLHHTDPFDSAELWRDAADFKTLRGHKLGIKLTRRDQGTGELGVYFDPAIAVEEKVMFTRYIHEHLNSKAQNVTRHRHYICPTCNHPVRDSEVAMKRLSQGKPSILCVSCENHVPLWDEIEDRFASQELKSLVQQMQTQSQLRLDNESKERVLVGEVISTVAIAGQLCREFNVSDHGIDMEIEFKDDNGRATGKRLYLQLKSGDAYLTIRKRDGAEIFRLPSQRHVDYWANQAFPVLLVIRSSDGDIRWMEVSQLLKAAIGEGNRELSQIVFDGERFDVMSIRRWRDRILKQ